MSSTKTKTAQDFINETGYPLQIRLEKCVKETEALHHWRVIASEHRWKDKITDSEGYIDLILGNTSIDMVMVIECKRFMGKWNFIIPHSQPSSSTKTKFLSVNKGAGTSEWIEDPLGPSIYDALFCVPVARDKKDDRTLEKMSGELLISLESLARIDTSLVAWQDSPQFPTPFLIRSFIPVIVTTADLTVTMINPTANGIDITKGVIKDSQTESINYIRFRKNLATSIDQRKPEINTLEKLNHEYDRSVFIVNSEYFIEFLGHFA